MSEAKIAFRRDMEFAYGRADQVSPLIRRMVAENPGPMGLYGTNSYIVGHGTVAVIDPGPELPAHVAALVDELAKKNERVSHIIVTHTHRDHSPAAALLKQATGAPVVGAYPRPIEGTEAPVEAHQTDFAADIVVKDGDRFAEDGWTLEAVHTPGHMSSHHCFALLEEKALFSGDHVMGWNTTIVSPPDGNMTEYFASLERCLARDDQVYWPGHGPDIPDPKPFVESYRAHRRQREQEILACIEAGATTVPEMVARIYTHLDDRMRRAAHRPVQAHLDHLVATGRVTRDGGTGYEARYGLA